MKLIRLTKNLSTVVDDADYEVLSSYKWCAVCTQKGKRWYAARGIKPDGKYKMILMHRVILGAEKGFEVDHINNDPLDNRRDNLRLCTRALNMHNRKSYNNSTSAFKGVFFDKQSGKWQAKITINNKSVYIGRSTNPEDCARMYDSAAASRYGEHAKLNFGR